MKKYPKPELTKGEKWLDSHLVTYPVSYRYNGGIVIDGQWHNGVSVPEPDVPEGFRLVDIGIGLQHNAQPPIATKYLEPIV